MKKSLAAITVLVLLLSGILLRGAFSLQNETQKRAPAKVSQYGDVKGAAQRLAGAIRFKTISNLDESKFPAGEFLGFHRFLEKAYPLVHESFQKEVINKYSLLYRLPGSNSKLKPILLMAHQDVVPVRSKEISQWRHSPFSGDIAEGHVWGRGSRDDKYRLIMTMEALESLLKQGYKPERDIYLAFGHDEEVSGLKGALQINDELKRRGVRFEFILDEGTAIYRNMIPGVKKPVALISLSEKGYLSLELSVSGAGGHASMPPPETTVGILATALHRLQKDPFPLRLTPPIQKMFESLGGEMGFTNRLVLGNLWLFSPILKMQLNGKNTTRALIHTTTAPTIFRGSVQENILPLKAKAVINFRILHGDTIASVRNRVKTIIDDPRIKIKILTHLLSDPSPISDFNSKSYKMLKQTVENIYPDALVAPTVIVAATDSRYFTGIADNVYRFTPLRINPDELKQFHGINERAPIAEMGNSIQFYRQLLQTAGGKPASSR